MLDLLYAQAVGARRRWYERYPEARRRLRAPVLSVGNLSVGGTGKTPLVRLIAEWLLSRGERPAVLSRGYARADALDGVEIVGDGTRIRSSVERAGDEPIMLATAIPEAIVCVCEDRHLAGVLAERQLGATVHLLDDGFQHVQLARDYDILVTAPGEIPSGRVLPFGRLRESRAAAARAHFVVVVGADHDAARREAWELGVGEFSAARRRLRTGGAAAAQAVRPSTVHAMAENVVAVAGIGQPQQFFTMLIEAGYRIVDRLTFADHHRYTRTDVGKIAAAARARNADAVVTTAKDAVRFSAFDTLPFALVPVDMELELDHWGRLTASLEHVLRQSREAA